MHYVGIGWKRLWRAIYRDVIEAHLEHLYNLHFHPGNTASIPDAWLHAAHRLPLHVDQQRGHLGHDGSCH